MRFIQGARAKPRVGWPHLDEPKKLCLRIYITIYGQRYFRDIKLKE